MVVSTSGCLSLQIRTEHAIGGIDALCQRVVMTRGPPAHQDSIVAEVARLVLLIIIALEYAAHLLAVGGRFTVVHTCCTQETCCTVIALGR